MKLKQAPGRQGAAPVVEIHDGRAKVEMAPYLKDALRVASHLLPGQPLRQQVAAESRRHSLLPSQISATDGGRPSRCLSRAVQWHLSQVLSERFGTTIPLVVWTRKPDSHVAEAAFWHALLMASKFQFLDPVKPPKRDAGAFLCKERFISLANNAGRNYVVLLIDEAHDMTLKEWKWLVGLQNDLDNEGYLLSVFSIGSHQLGYKHDYLASTGNAHIAARFMVTHARFHGIRSAAELGYVLTGYDVDSEWPAGSGKSFLRYFAPSYFDDGRRIADHSTVLWEAMIKLRPESAQRFNEFPMQHIARVVEKALKRLAKGDTWSDNLANLGNMYEDLSREWFCRLFLDNLPHILRDHLDRCDGYESCNDDSECLAGY